MPVAQVAKLAAGSASRTCTDLATSGLSLIRKTTKGRARWYLLRMPQTRKEALCAKLKRLLPKDVLLDAFVLRKERWIRRQKRWFLQPVDMYQSYAFAISADPTELSSALAHLTLPAELVGDKSQSWTFLADEVASWYAQVADSYHIIKNSTAEIVGGVLRVYSGPLVGKESHISKIDRHRRFCTVRIGEGGFSEQLPIEVPHKS